MSPQASNPQKNDAPAQRESRVERRGGRLVRVTTVEESVEPIQTVEQVAAAIARSIRDFKESRQLFEPGREHVSVEVALAEQLAGELYELGLLKD